MSLRKLLFTALLFFVLPAMGQPLIPPIQGFSPDDYDAHPQILCIERGPNGIMRFGTYRQLLSYDGTAWRKEGLKVGTALASMETDPGKDGIWFGARGGFGFFAHSPEKAPLPDSLRNGSFFSLRPLLPDSIKEVATVWNTVRLGDRTFFNDFRHIYAYDGQSLQVHRPRSNSFYYAFKVDGELWVQDSALSVYDEKKAAFRRLKGSSELAPYSVTMIQEWGEGPEEDHLIGTRRNGLFLFNPEEGSVERFAPSLSDTLKTLGILSSSQLPPSNTMGRASLAIGTITGGVLFIDKGGEVLLQVDQDKGLENDLIWDLHFDPERGILWSATNKGISRSEMQSRISLYPEGASFKGKVLDLYRSDEAEKESTKKGTLPPLILTTSQAAYSFRSEREGPIPEQRFKKIPGTEGQCTDLLSMEGELLIPLQALHAFEKDEKGKWSKRTVDDRDFYAMAPLPDGRGFVAAGANSGLVIFERKGERWVSAASPDLEFVGVNSVECFEDPRTGRPVIWIGGAAEKLYRVLPASSGKGEKWSWKNVRVFRSDSSDGLPSGPLRVFEWKGSPLIGTLEGLYAPRTSGGDGDPKELSFAPHELQRTLMEGKKEDVLLFRSFSDSSFWVQSSGRLERWSLGDGEDHSGDTISFVRKGMGNVRAVLEDPFEESIAWIGHDRGLARYDPSTPLKRARDIPCLVRKVYGVTSPESGGKKRDTLLYEGQKKVFTRETPIPYSRNELTFEFAAPFYQDKGEIEYHYKLLGYDRKWSEWSRSARKEYTNLREGSYRFKVQASDLHWNKSLVGEFRFTVAPPWYRTWPAYASYAAGGFALIFLLLRLNGRRLRVRKEHLEKLVVERTREIRDKKERIEEAHRDITAGIDYAERIQKALLGSGELIKAHFPEQFIFFLPRQKVSGDFYWAREHKGQIYIAAVDCTGHGVPAAFMSILGLSYLNEIMNSDEFLSPGTVLTRLHDRLRQGLSQRDDRALDGMDASMIRIPLSREEGPLEACFAGANDPIYLLRKGVAESEFQNVVGENASKLLQGGRIKPFKQSPDGIEIRGDRQQLGFDEEEPREFTDIPLKLREGDRLYLFSDGFADQFGGPSGKKFRFGPFKELLTRIHENPLQEQKEELERTFEAWKAESDQEQIDDVLVMGIRI